MCMDSLRQYSNETRDFDGEFQVLWQQMQKHVHILDPLLSFMISFQTCKVHNMLAMLLTPFYKGLGLFIWYVGKERAFQITSEWDINVLFPFFVYAYKF
jgi:hypothetical protein